ncbi:hypothetical protein JW905_15955 [bacterium]|nr:hypothetical protein [candidate division CSSED10-310 bacterium]
MARKTTMSAILLISVTAEAGHAGLSVGDENDLAIGADFAVQCAGYFGDEEEVYVPDDGYMIRHAALSLEGKLGEYLEYGVEMGASRCPASGASDVMLLEAGF